MCPGDNVTFICNLTVLEIQFDYLTLTWVNPKNDSDPRPVYGTTGALTMEEYVGGFSTEFIEGDNNRIVSSATLSNVTKKDDRNKEIECKYNNNRKSRTVSLSGVGVN